MKHALRRHDSGSDESDAMPVIVRLSHSGWRWARIAPSYRGAAGIAPGFVGRLADILDIGCVVLRASVNSNSRRTRASLCQALLGTEPGLAISASDSVPSTFTG
jgi:hypothetical protein